MQTFNLIRAWATERGLYDKGDLKTQYIKLNEEVGELAEAILKEDNNELIDAIGDIVVVLTNLTEIANLSIIGNDNVTIEDCVNYAYQEIKDRKGKMENGTFKKA
jgi:NTP pyrophosphatase (non-canonical NTP hydrolase)